MANFQIHGAIIKVEKWTIGTRNWNSSIGRLTH